MECWEQPGLEGSKGLFQFLLLAPGFQSQARCGTAMFNGDVCFSSGIAGKSLGGWLKMELHFPKISFFKHLFGLDLNPSSPIRAQAVTSHIPAPSQCPAVRTIRSHHPGDASRALSPLPPATNSSSSKKTPPWSSSSLFVLLKLGSGEEQTRSSVWGQLTRLVPGVQKSAAAGALQVR